MNKETTILIWKIPTTLFIGIGLIFIISSYFLLEFEILTGEVAKFIFLTGLTLTSIGLGSLSVIRSLESEKRISDLEKKEINRKLTMLQEENNSNINFIDLLIKRKKNYFPQKLLEKKLKQQKTEKLNLTPNELKQIANGGLWIPKGTFSYNYAQQVIEIAHYLDDSFINEVRNYIKIGEKLNIRKESCHQWAIVRGRPNPDETNNYYATLDEAKEVTDEMKKLSIAQLEQHKL